MPKKALVIIIILAILALAGWLVFGRGASTPTPSREAVSTEAPFGTPETSAAENLPSDFEGALTPLATTPTSDVGTGTEALPVLFRIENSPVGGFVTLTRGNTTVVRYVERSTGNIFDTTLGSSLTKARVTNQTIPQIYEAYFRTDGNAALFRSLDEFDTVKNMSVALTGPKASSTDGLWSVSMTLLRGKMDGISMGTGDMLSYVLPDSRAIVSSKFSGDAVKTLWSGEFTAWRTVKLGASLLIFTKPSASIAGYAYRLSQGSLTKLLGPLNGLIAIANPAATTILYSYANNGTSLIARDVAKGSEVELLPGTTADKCVGSALQKTVFYCGAPSVGVGGSQPDLWYQGKTHFADEIWSFDSVTGSAYLVADPEERFGAMLDVSLPVLSADEKYLVFMNKRDLSLWALTLR